jgi:hypothetical protein
LFPWLRHLFADSVYNGPNLRDAWPNLVTGRQQQFKIDPLEQALVPPIA